jgi:hypothetical protein
MNKLLTLLFTCTAILISIASFAQAPSLMNYQAIARDSNGVPLTEQDISVRFSIHDEVANGPIVFSETHQTTTGALGLFNLLIGGGNVIEGLIENIDWLSTDKFLEVEIDIEGGNNFVELGTVQFVSVPYSLAAQTTYSIHESTELNIEQLSQNGALTGQVLAWDGTNWLPTTSSTGTLYNAGTGISISGSTITNTGDLSNTNEIQTISISGSTVTLSNGGGSVVVPSVNVYSEGVGIDIIGTTITNTGDLNSTNEIQTLSLTGTNLSLSNGGGNVTLPTGTNYTAGSGISIIGNSISANDNSSSNEIQNLSINGDALSISGGNTINLPAGTAYTAGDGISISGNTITATDVSDVNEIQFLNISGSEITLSGGGGGVFVPNSWISLANNNILNPNFGNVSIDPIGFTEPLASLDVSRGTGLFGTTAFRGTGHISHFNYGTSEDSFIRGGKSGAHVYLNDSHNGNVNIVTGGGGLGIGVNANLSYKTQLYSTFGKGMRIDVVGGASGSPEGLAITLSSPSDFTKYGIYSENSGLGVGDNYGILGKAFGASSGFKIGVFGEATGTGLTAECIGVLGIANNSTNSTNYGVQGFANAYQESAFNIGLYGYASGSIMDYSVPGIHLQGGFGNNHNANIGVYGATSDIFDWAGFFNGDVYAYDVYYSSSDSTLKTNVSNIKKGLEIVKKLRPVSYQMKTSPNRNAPFNDQLSYGFIAQEVGRILPELVTTLVNPADLKDKTDDVSMLALNYDGFIPILTEAIQEQQTTIEIVQSEITTLKQELNAEREKNALLEKELQTLHSKIELILSKINP